MLYAVPVRSSSKKICKTRTAHWAPDPVECITVCNAGFSGISFNKAWFGCPPQGIHFGTVPVLIALWIRTVWIMAIMAFFVFWLRHITLL